MMKVHELFDIFRSRKPTKGRRKKKDADFDDLSEILAHAKNWRKVYGHWFLRMGIALLIMLIWLIYEFHFVFTLKHAGVGHDGVAIPLMAKASIHRSVVNSAQQYPDQDYYRTFVRSRENRVIPGFEDKAIT